jgi:hypothetical protein
VKRSHGPLSTVPYQECVRAIRHRANSDCYPAPSSAVVGHDPRYLAIHHGRRTSPLPWHISKGRRWGVGEHDGREAGTATDHVLIEPNGEVRFRGLVMSV